MNKKILVLMLLLLCMTGCEYKSSNKMLVIGTDSDLKLTKIYKLTDGDIYSEFKTIGYTDSETDLISLSKALKQKKITVDEIIEKNQDVQLINDGGSVLYTFKVEQDSVADRDFYILKCKENSKGKKDIIIGSENIIAPGCLVER